MHRSVLGDDRKLDLSPRPRDSVKLWWMLTLQSLRFNNVQKKATPATSRFMPVFWSEVVVHSLLWGVLISPDVLTVDPAI